MLRHISARQCMIRSICTTSVQEASKRNSISKKKNLSVEPEPPYEPPKLWAVTLIKPLKGCPRVLQRLAKHFDLQSNTPVPLPNIPSVNERLIGMGDMVYVQPLVISDTPYPYAEHPRMGLNGVFYPSADAIEEIQQLWKS